jgi:hypothetical protein
MQFYAKSQWHAAKTGFIFIAAMFIAYLPISSFLFFIKNDAFTGYFPPKYFISESLHAGYLPLWNPYINYGIPQYGDMSSAFWNPLTWLIAGTVGYNAYTFTLELLFYLVAGGVGMYRLLKHWQIATPIRLLAGVAYMCCGYQVGHLQHFNWISGAALLPWCMWSYLWLLNKTCSLSILCTALFFYLLVSTAHPGISIGALYFFLAAAIFCLFNASSKKQFELTIKKFAYCHFFLLLAFLLLAAGMLAGYADTLPHITRGQKISLQGALTAPTNFKSWISLLLPMATVKNDNWFATDVSMRNCYMGLLPLVFLLACFVGKKTAWQKFLLCAAAFFVLLSAGGFFKTIAYYSLPLTGFVRLNGEFAIFALFCAIIVAAQQMNQYHKSEKTDTLKITRILNVLQWIAGMACMAGLAAVCITSQSVFFELDAIVKSSGIASQLKNSIAALSFWDTLWIQGIIQFCFLLAIKTQLANGNIKNIVRIGIAELLLATLLNVPFTGAGKASVAQIQAILQHAPKGIPLPNMQPIQQHPISDKTSLSMIGHWSFYNKQIGTATPALYPIELSHTVTYQDNAKQKNYFGQPPFFTQPADSGYIKYCSFSPNSTTVEIATHNPALLVYQQAYYPHWYAVVNQQKIPIQMFDSVFMATPVTKGTQKITFVFEPRWPKLLMFFSFVVLLLYAAIIVLQLASQPKKDK